MKLLRVDKLSVEFMTAPTIRVLDEVSFDLEAGETLALVGESGSGKTVTASALIGLLPDSASIRGGRIVFQEQDLTSLPEKRWRPIRGRDISMVFQDPNSALNPVLTIGTQVIETLRAHRSIDRRRATALAIGLLDQVGLPQPAARMRDYPHQLSGGMRQRVVIAMAIANRPRLIIADEATTALDATVQDQIVSLMQALCAQNGSSLLWISHDLALVARIAQRVLVMYAGRIVEQGPVDQILRSPRHPYTQALLQAHPERRSRRLVALPGQTPPPGLSALPGCVFRDRCERRQDQCEESPPPRPSEGAARVSCWFPLSTNAATERSS